MLKKTKGKKILLGWNRGLGDIALGLYAIVQRIRTFIPDAEITFITRENLKDGFSMLEGVKTIVALDWKRGMPAAIPESLRSQFDLVIEKPSPTDWVSWQHGQVTPRLKWDKKHDLLYEKFEMSSSFTFVGVQVSAETAYGLWRNWPIERWQELFSRLKHITFVLFGYGDEPPFLHPNIVDLRGKTTLFELLSIVQNRCSALILPDSGIAAMVYYLDRSFPLRMISLWADPNQGILKQGVSSPNPRLVHCPLIGKGRDLATVSVDAVIAQLFPVGAILLAGGQGTRLGFNGPKGMFSIAGKTLFQRFCEKVPKETPLAIMTSQINHDETVSYFQKNGYFGLEIYFFQQEMAPLLDEEKRPTEMQGPNGNGGVFRAFVKAGLGDLFAKKGIDLVTVSYVDNPLAHPVDAALIAHARSERTDALVQCIERLESDHSMGALVETGDRLQVVEYTELDPTQIYQYAYSGQIAFALPFFCQMAQHELPLHWVRKEVRNRWVWKGEQFIFDALPFASRARRFPVLRRTHYAPLKSGRCVEAVEKQLRDIT